MSCAGLHAKAPLVALMFSPTKIKGGATHRSGRIAKVDLEAAHGSDDGDDGLDGVAVHHRLVLLTLLLRVARLVDDPGGSGSAASLTFLAVSIFALKSENF